MERIKICLLLVSMVAVVVLAQSCKKELESVDPCLSPAIICENGGICVEGLCECLYGFIGAHCETLDTSIQIQSLLYNGVTPKDLYDAGIPIDSLYGKTYLDGFIFYLDTIDGSGMVVSRSDEADGIKVRWGCLFNQVNATGVALGDGAANTDAILARCTEGGIAAQLCRDRGPNWFLPSKDELSLIRVNLYVNDHVDFDNQAYWSSSELDPHFAWFQGFAWGTQNTANKNSEVPVRAVRAF